jgi:hypothetical protein
MKKSELERKLYATDPNIYSIGFLEFENGVDFKYCSYVMGLPYTSPIFGAGHIDHLGNVIVEPNYMTLPNPRSISKANWPQPPPGRTTSGAVRTGECNHEMPGLPYPAFRRVNAEPGGRQAVPLPRKALRKSLFEILACQWSGDTLVSLL